MLLWRRYFFNNKYHSSVLFSEESSDKWVRVYTSCDACALSPAHRPVKQTSYKAGFVLLQQPSNESWTNGLGRARWFGLRLGSPQRRKCRNDLKIAGVTMAGKGGITVMGKVLRQQLHPSQATPPVRAVATSVAASSISVLQSNAATMRTREIPQIFAVLNTTRFCLLSISPFCFLMFPALIAQL